MGKCSRRDFGSPTGGPVKGGRSTHLEVFYGFFELIQRHRREPSSNRIDSNRMKTFFFGSPKNVSHFYGSITFNTTYKYKYWFRSITRWTTFDLERTDHPGDGARFSVVFCPILSVDKIRNIKKNLSS